MHPEAYAGAREMVQLSGLDTAKEYQALDVGGVDINGTARDLLPNANWTGVDIVPGPGVDLVEDATTWRSDRRFEVVFSTETLEHCEGWDKLLDTIAHHLSAEGPEVVVLTCASTGRKPHSADGAEHVKKGEYYGNVDPEVLEAALKKRFKEVHVKYQKNPGDAYAWARGVKREAPKKTAPAKKAATPRKAPVKKSTDE